MDWQKHFAERSRETSTFGSQDEDIDAINEFFAREPIHTSEAAKIKDEWIKWHDDLGWYSKNYDSAAYDEARNIRNRFNIANAITAEDKAFVRTVQQTGFSTEEMQGGVKRVLSDGTYSTPNQPLIPTAFKVGVGATLLTAGLGYAAYKLYFPASLLRSFKRA